ncbi:MAG: GNAT family N-acetyltransferase [Lachnospiraceae bacterium]
MLQKIRKNDFDQVYALMEISFPYDEYRGYEEQKELLKQPNYTVYVLPDDDNIKAFITVYQFENFAFVEHFAVKPSYRNSGIGAAILQELSILLQCQICLEVELPETEVAKKRIKFYERNGFYLNNYPYVQPPFSEDKCAIPLFIMTTNHPLNEAEFNYIKSVLFKEVYHVHYQE